MVVGIEWKINTRLLFASLTSNRPSPVTVSPLGLASCVAKELEQASFRKVQKQQMGTVVTVKF